VIALSTATNDVRSSATALGDRTLLGVGRLADPFTRARLTPAQRRRALQIVAADNPPRSRQRLDRFHTTTAAATLCFLEQ